MSQLVSSHCTRKPSIYYNVVLNVTSNSGGWRSIHSISFVKAQSFSRSRVLHVVFDILIVHKGDFLEVGYVVFRWRDDADSMRGCLGRPHRRVFAIRAQLGRHRISASLVRRTHQVCIGRYDFGRAAHASVTSGGVGFLTRALVLKDLMVAYLSPAENQAAKVFGVTLSRLLLFVGSGCVRYRKPLC